MKHKELIEEAVQAASEEFSGCVKIGNIEIGDSSLDQIVHIHVDEAMNTLALALIENGKAIQKVAELAKPAESITSGSCVLEIVPGRITSHSNSEFTMNGSADKEADLKITPQKTPKVEVAIDNEADLKD